MTPARSLFDEALSEVIKRTALETAEAFHRRRIDQEVERRVAERLGSDELSTAQVCALLSIHRSTLATWRAKGFPAPKMNPSGTVRFSRSDVEAWRSSRPLSSRTK